MPKSTDVPGELRDFNRIFQKFEYRHEHSQVFSDFLDLFIKQFSFDNCEELNNRIQKQYNQEERFNFGALIQEAIKVLNKEIRGDHDWYDIFGTYYEVLANDYKRQGFGQFFTPPHIVDLMTGINGGKSELTGQGLLIGDPCSGSGRMLISFQAHFPGNFLVGQDIDLICCKMTILNMILHGCKGEVVWGNSLDPSDFRQGWRISPYIAGIPQVYKIDKSESFTWRLWENEKERILIKQAEKLIKESPEKPKQPVQLALNFV